VPQGAAATYCFTVTNTGASHLDAITITDALVAGDVVLASADSVPLAPGHSARYHLQTAVPADAADGAVDGTFVNTASMAAVAVTPDGTPVDGAAGITATAEATVYPPLELPTASIELGTSVYAGHDGGVGCPAADVTVVSEGDNITYCFMITNTGNTYLDSITIADPYLTGSPQLIRTDSMPLAPGDSALYHLDATAPGLPPDGFLYTSDVTANAVDEAGADLTGVTEAAATDDTRVAAGAPLQLAFTGWETWLVAAAGLALSAGGWALLRSSDRRDPLSDRPSDRSQLAAAEPR
jgi:hypothetical protein